MRLSAPCTFAVSLLLWFGGASLAEDALTGSYTHQSMSLTLQQGSGNAVSGELSGGGNRYSLNGVAQSGGAVGSVGGANTRLGFEAVPEGDGLLLVIYGIDAAGMPQRESAERYLFVRDRTDAATGAVYINGAALDGETLQALQDLYRVRVVEGRYWYDAMSGAWGIEGGPTAGFLLPGLNLGGALSPNASGGGTGVFFNGRELHLQDALALQQLLGTVIPGRYSLDAYGNLAVENGRWLLNLVQLARQAQGSTTYRSNITGIGAGSSGGTSYVMGEDWWVIVGD